MLAPNAALTAKGFLKFLHTVSRMREYAAHIIVLGK